LNAALLAAPLVAGSTVVAFADCVSGLANCAIECDQRIKPDDPYRPQCAQACVSTYQRCARAEIIRQGTGGGILSPGKLAPSQ
jgi:hypothetical protein